MENEKEDLLNKIKIKDYKMISHMSTYKYHVSRYSGIFECEGNVLHNKTFIGESKTKVISFMKYGKTSCLFYLDAPNSKTFKSIKSLVYYYNK